MDGMDSTKANKLRHEEVDCELTGTGAVALWALPLPRVAKFQLYTWTVVAPLQTPVVSS